MNNEQQSGLDYSHHYMMDNIRGEVLIVNSDFETEEDKLELHQTTRGQRLNNYSGTENYCIRKRGLFFRGYSSDLFNVSHPEGALELSRDGIMRMLPEALFFDEQMLLEATSDDDLKKRKTDIASERNQLEIFFEAFDTIFGRRELELHNTIDTLESEKEAFVLKEMYGVDVRRLRNPHVKKLARLLLDSDKLKGNIELVPFFVRAILGAKTSCRRANRVSNDANSIYHTELQFIIYIENLTSEEYRQRMEEFEEFFWYLEQWFLPYDCDVDFCIKDPNRTFFLGEQMTLDYNIRI